MRVAQSTIRHYTSSSLLNSTVQRAAPREAKGYDAQNVRRQNFPVLLRVDQLGKNKTFFVLNHRNETIDSTVFPPSFLLLFFFKIKSNDLVE
jgi:hypothetical protein